MTNPTNPSPDTPIPSELVQLLRKLASHSIPRVGIYDACRQAASLILTQEANIKELVEALQALVPMFARFEKSDLNHQCAHAAFVDGNEKWEAWRKARSVLSSNMRGAG